MEAQKLRNPYLNDSNVCFRKFENIVLGMMQQDWNNGVKRGEKAEGLQLISANGMNRLSVWTHSGTYLPLKIWYGWWVGVCERESKRKRERERDVWYNVRITISIQESTKTFMAGTCLTPASLNMVLFSFVMDWFACEIVQELITWVNWMYEYTCIQRCDNQYDRKMFHEVCFIYVQ